MKTILTLLLALSVTTGLASPIVAAAEAADAPYAVATTGPNDPPFGSPQWWDQESDRGG
jgi:hypothetical protein